MRKLFRIHQLTHLKRSKVVVINIIYLRNVKFINEYNYFYTTE